MDFWDSIVESYNNTVDAVQDTLSDYINLESDRTAERLADSATGKLQDASAVPVYQQPTSVTPDQYKTASGGINWTKWGVIVGVAGLALTVYKLAK